MKKFIVIVLLLSAGLVAYAQGHDHDAMMKSDSGNDMMAQHEKMMTDMKAMDAKLDEMVAAMNAATGDKKMDAMAALLTEMIAQRRKMQGMMMMSMHHPMMQGCGDKEGCAHMGCGGEKGDTKAMGCCADKTMDCCKEKDKDGKAMPCCSGEKKESN